MFTNWQRKVKMCYRVVMFVWEQGKVRIIRPMCATESAGTTQKLDHVSTPRHQTSSSGVQGIYPVDSYKQAIIMCLLLSKILKEIETGFSQRYGLIRGGSKTSPRRGRQSLGGGAYPIF